jgi:hypothetical protein
MLKYCAAGTPYTAEGVAVFSNPPHFGVFRDALAIVLELLHVSRCLYVMYALFSFFIVIHLTWHCNSRAPTLQHNFNNFKY